MTSLGTSGQSELGRTSCSRVPRCWSACPRRRILFFRNRRGYCCTNDRVECSLESKGLAGQAVSIGRRTGSCCCSCKPAISVGEARWSGPPQTASVPNSSAPLSQRLLTAPLHCLPVPPDSSATLSPGDSSTSNPARKRQVCRGVVWGVEGSRLEAWMKSQVRGCYNITFYLHTNQPGNCRLSPEMNT